jgi:hypothetical protein
MDDIRRPEDHYHMYLFFFKYLTLILKQSLSICYPTILGQKQEKWKIKVPSRFKLSVKGLCNVCNNEKCLRDLWVGIILEWRGGPDGNVKLRSSLYSGLQNITQ